MIKRQVIQQVQLRFKSKQKNQLIPLSDIPQMLFPLIKGACQSDLTSLIQSISYPSQLCLTQLIQIYLFLQHESKKVFTRIQPPFGLFIFQSFIRIKNQDNKCQLGIDCSQNFNARQVNVSRGFNQILTEDYLKKLILIGPNGLINQKQDEKLHKYQFNHWVEAQVDFLIMETQKIQAQILKYIWSFNFTKAFELGKMLYQNIDKYQRQGQQLNQISILLPGLQNLSQINTLLSLDQTLYNLIHCHATFSMIPKQQPLRKSSSQSEFLSNYQKFQQLFTFTQQFFQMIQPQITNPYFKMICIFIANKIDDKELNDDVVQEFASFNQIGVLQRYIYAKKFYNQDMFELFKIHLKKNAEKTSDIWYILLFGNRKQSENILQNYIDQTNQIQKAALISVYLKTFSQQSKITTIREQKNAYTKFIGVYQWLLDKLDGGISRHNFDKKCLSIQIQRKRKNLTKTFTFDCSNCKSPQISSVLQKKINIDSKQPKLKGYHYFAKDTRSQIMYCIQCMQLLPRCSICLYPISVFNAYAEEMKKNVTQRKLKNQGEGLAQAVVWCPKCKHGGHFQHVVQWFQKNCRKCPVVNCKCKCAL